MTNIKSCPFCGTEMEEGNFGREDFYYPMFRHPATDCILGGREFSKDNLERWNRRSSKTETVYADAFDRVIRYVDIMSKDTFGYFDYEAGRAYERVYKMLKEEKERIYELLNLAGLVGDQEPHITKVVEGEKDD